MHRRLVIEAKTEGVSLMR
nr:hypothetical protein [Corynebacterium capitovis]